MYELNSRVRYSETDIDAKLSLTGIMNYMQDCSTMQSEDRDRISWTGKEGVAFILLADRDRTPSGPRGTDQGSDMALCSQGTLRAEKFRNPR